MNVAEETIPSTLLALMEVLVPKLRKVKEEVLRKTVSISYAIISTDRQRSFISPIINRNWLLYT